MQGRLNIIKTLVMKDDEIKSWTIECGICGKPIRMCPSAERLNKRFCSKLCLGLSMVKRIQTINGVDGKVCSKCRKWVPLNGFHKGNNMDGLGSQCKGCVKVYQEGYKSRRNEKSKEKFVKANPTISQDCIVCGQPFKTRKERNKKYCSEKCRKQAYSCSEKGVLAKRANSHKRRVLNKRAGKLEIADMNKVYYDNIKIHGKLTCVYCDGICENDWHLDHKMPLSRGGGNETDNLVISCSSCNLRKGAKTVEEFEAYNNLKIAN